MLGGSGVLTRSRWFAPCLKRQLCRKRKRRHVLTPGAWSYIRLGTRPTDLKIFCQNTTAMDWAVQGETSESHAQAISQCSERSKSGNELLLCPFSLLLSTDSIAALTIKGKTRYLATKAKSFSAAVHRREVRVNTSGVSTPVGGTSECQWGVLRSLLG